MKVQRGFSLIELMVALTLGLLVLGGVVTIFVHTSDTYQVQEGMARLQENGRFALSRLSDDMRMAAYQGCSSRAFTGLAGSPTGSGMRNRAVDVYLPAGPGPGSGLPSFAQVQAATGAVLTPNLYPLDPKYFIIGHDCATGNCNPSFGTLGADPVISTKTVGTSDGDLADNSDIVTVRYMMQGGVPVGGDFFGNQSIPLESGQDPTQAPLNLQANDLVMVADCGRAVVLNFTGLSANAIAHAETLPAFERAKQARVYNFTQGFVTVTYYVEIRDQADGTQIGVLMRNENGNAEEIVRGVDQLQVRYLVEDGNGDVRYVNASAAQTRAGGSFECPPEPDDAAFTRNMPGCLFGAVRAIEMSLLMNSVDDVAATGAEPYTYFAQGPGTTFVPGDHPDSGLAPGDKLRRQFTTVVGVRAYHL